MMYDTAAERDLARREAEDYRFEQTHFECDCCGNWIYDGVKYAHVKIRGNKYIICSSCIEDMQDDLIDYDEDY